MECNQICRPSSRLLTLTSDHSPRNSVTSTAPLILIKIKILKNPLTLSILLMTGCSHYDQASSNLKTVQRSSDHKTSI
jgi:hypothetical protein